MPKPWQSAANADSKPDQSVTSADDNDDSPTAVLLASLKQPQNLLATGVLTSIFLGGGFIYRTRLRRVRNVAHLPPRLLHPSIPRHNHSLFGRVLTVPDGDGLRLYHTPGGRLALWHLFRKVPTHPLPRTPTGEDSFLKQNTLSVRLSGIDAPEGPHFGKPGQPWAEEALEYLKGECKGKDVRLLAHSKDQYGRVVGTVLLRPWRGWGVGLPKTWSRDIGAELVEKGLATVYEGKTGVEFGGGGREGRLRELEETARLDGVGMWSDRGRRANTRGAKDGAEEGGLVLGTLTKLWRIITGGQPEEAGKTKFETPREFKTRMAKEDKANEKR